MGLDISHCKATLVKPQTSDPWQLLGSCQFTDDFLYFDVPVNHFSGFIQEIEYPNFLRSLVIIHGRDKEEHTRFHFNYPDDASHLRNEFSFIIDEKDGRLDHEIALFEKQNGLDSLLKHPGEPNWDISWHIITYYEILRKEGFYHEDAGYQRRGMNKEFDKRFKRDDIYKFALREDFEFAYTCVDFCWPQDTEKEVEIRRQNFKKNFLDNFEFGASFMWLGY